MGKYWNQPSHNRRSKKGKQFSVNLWNKKSKKKPILVNPFITKSFKSDIEINVGTDNFIPLKELKVDESKLKPLTQSERKQLYKTLDQSIGKHQKNYEKTYSQTTKDIIADASRTYSKKDVQIKPDEVETVVETAQELIDKPIEEVKATDIDSGTEAKGFLLSRGIPPELVARMSPEDAKAYAKQYREKERMNREERERDLKEDLKRKAEQHEQNIKQIEEEKKAAEKQLKLREVELSAEEAKAKQKQIEKRYEAKKAKEEAKSAMFQAIGQSKESTITTGMQRERKPYSERVAAITQQYAEIAKAQSSEAPKQPRQRMTKAEMDTKLTEQIRAAAREYEASERMKKLEKEAKQAQKKKEAEEKRKIKEAKKKEKEKRYQEALKEAKKRKAEKKAKTKTKYFLVKDTKEIKTLKSTKKPKK